MGMEWKQFTIAVTTQISLQWIFLFGNRVVQEDLTYLRTVSAHLASRPYLVYNFSWGKKMLFTPPPCMFFLSQQQYSSDLIEWFWSCQSFTVQTYFFVVRRISCTNVYVVSWSCNFVFKVNEWSFLTHGWVVGPKKFCVLMTPDLAPHWRHSSWRVFETVSHISEIFEFCCTTFNLLIFSNEAIIGFSFNEISIQLEQGRGPCRRI